MATEDQLSHPPIKAGILRLLIDSQKTPASMALATKALKLSMGSPFKMMRRPEVTDSSGDARSTLYLKIAQGLYTHPVKLSSRSSAWPDYEVDLLNKARAAGLSEGEIRQLVTALEALRREWIDDLTL